MHNDRNLLLGIFTFLACFALTFTCSGCGASLTAKPFVGPDGSPNWVSIQCRQQEDCLTKAGELCPGGYQVMSNERRREVWTPSEGFLTQSKGHLVLRCSEAPTAPVAPEATATSPSYQNR